MKSCFAIVFASSAFVTLSSAQCALKQQDHPNCAGWRGQGFCSNPFYTANQRAYYCGNACGLCCKDADRNCAKYQAASFCQNRFYTPAQKASMCAKTCNLCNAVAVQTTTTTTAKPTTTTTAAITDCMVDFDDGTSFTVKRTNTFGEVPLAGKKAKSVRVPESCTIEFTRKAAPTPPLDYIEAIGLDGDVTATTTGAATTLFAKCICRIGRGCATTIDSAGTPRVNFFSRLKDTTTYAALALAGKTIDRIDVPTGCTMRLADDAAGTNAEIQTKAKFLNPGSTKSFVNCNCP